MGIIVRCFCWAAIFLAAGHGLVIAAEDQRATAFAPYIEKNDDRLDDLIDVDAKIEVISTGHQWVEGPCWFAKENALLFSDVPRNRIHRWQQDAGTSVFLQPSGFDGPSRSQEPGSNGLATDAAGRLIVCDHGNRRVYRLEDDGSKTTLVDRFEGKRFNSPNDLVLDSAGNIYFTDPPYGMIDPDDSELGWFGVYRLSPNGDVKLLIKDLHRPNGIGLSPDNKTLYVAQSHKPAAVFMAYSIDGDGQMSESKVLLDFTHRAGIDPGMPDGMVVDKSGNLWATGPGGVLIIAPDGTLLGRIMMGKKTANCTFGEEGSTLFMTATDTVCRVKTKTIGLKFVEGNP